MVHFSTFINDQPLLYALAAASEITVDQGPENDSALNLAKKEKNAIIKDVIKSLALQNSSCIRMNVLHNSLENPVKPTSATD
jgi:hypothetical protein